jgi:hypothetical protein
MKELRVTVRNFILGATFILALMLLFRFVLILVGASEAHFVSGFIYNLTGPLMQPLEGFNWVLVAGFTFDFTVLIAVVFYITLGILISSFVTAFIDDDPLKIAMEVIDSIFKFIEFLLLVRFILRVFAVFYNQSPLSNSVYDLTAWAPGLLPDIKFGNGVIELSTLLILVIVIAIDLGFENFFEKYVEPRVQVAKVKSAPPAPAPVIISAPQPQVIMAPAPQPIFMQQPSPVVMPAMMSNGNQALPAPRPSQPQNIVINVPMPPQNSPAKPA